MSKAEFSSAYGLLEIHDKTTQNQNIALVDRTKGSYIVFLFKSRAWSNPSSESNNT